MATKKMTLAQDMKLDKKAGIKEGSKRDNALDKKRGVPTMKKGGSVKCMKKGGKC